MKALSFNIPVIVSDLPELASHVAPNKTGIVLNIDNIDSWISSIINYYNHQDLLKEMSIYIREYKNRYEPSQIAHKLYSISGPASGIAHTI